MSKCPIKTKIITLVETIYDEDSFGDTNPPGYISKDIEWPEDEHYWEIRGFFGKYKQCKKCHVVET